MDEYMKVFAVGRVPFRPLGVTHFSPAPWATDVDSDYQPAILSREAMRNGLAKFTEPIKRYDYSQLCLMEEFLVKRMTPFWFGDLVQSDADVVSDLNMKKSSGWPHNLPKGECLEQFAVETWELVEAVMRGEDVAMYFNATLKDELRTRDRVMNQKTRVFNACDMVHLICSKKLFGLQNVKIMESIGHHPSTVGISMPGPQFVTAILSLKENIYEGDVGGCDARFNLGLARVIRNVRARFLPFHYREAVHNLYDSVYCGHSITGGVIYRLFHNKSGWENTIWDTFLMMWAQIWEACHALKPDIDFDNQVRLKINGDDLLFACDYPGLGIKELSAYLAQYGTVLEYATSDPGGPEDVTFLSSSLRWRHVDGKGDFLVAAGNRLKLVSSVNFVKRSGDMTLEESCVVHLLGLRVCLWPFYFDWIEVNAILDEYLKSITLTDSIRQLLRARITEEHILALHCRYEGGLDLPIFSDLHDDPREIYEAVRKSQNLINYAPVSLSTLQMAFKSKKGQAVPTPAQRVAQSNRDKMLHAKATGALVPLTRIGTNRSVAKKAKQTNMLAGPNRGPRGNQFPSGSSSGRQIKMTEDVVGDEYITNIAGSSGFATTKFSVNPGLAATFPEGSVKASLFTEWRMKSCQFYYRPAVSGFATQGQSGRVVLSMDYNAANATPTTQQQVEVMPHRDGMPFENIELPLDARYVNRADSKYIRVGALGISEDVKTYDGGNLWVSTYGQTNTTQVGE